MDMKINVDLLKNLRNEKAWSQDQLASVAGVSLRTVQRIENSGNASLESKKAIASAFGIKASDLDFNENESAVPDDLQNFCFRVEEGTKLAEVVGGAYAYRLNHDSPNSEEEAEVLASAAQSIQDWGDIWSDIEAGDRVKATFDMSQLIEELEEWGFWVFALRTNEEHPAMKGKEWPVANVMFVRSDNPKIIQLDLGKEG